MGTHGERIISGLRLVILNIWIKRSGKKFEVPFLNEKKCQLQTSLKRNGLVVSER